LLLALAVRRFRLWPPRCRGSRREQRPEARRLELVLEPPFQHLSGRVLVGGSGLQRVAHAIEDGVARRAETTCSVGKRAQRVPLALRRHRELDALRLRLAQRVARIDEGFELLAT